MKLAQWFWRRRFLKFVHVFSLFHNYLPLEKDGALYLNKLDSPLPERYLCQVWLKLARWFWTRRFFKFRQFIFAISLLSPLWKGLGPSFEQTLIPFTQGCFVPGLVEIGPVVLKKKISKYFHVILLFHFYLPFKKGVALHLNKLESPPPKDALCQVWLKLAQWFWTRRFLINLCFLFHHYLP